MFIGRYQHTIDPKGRVSVPARYRNVLAQHEGNLIVVPQDQCLNVYPLTAWERVVGALNDQSQFDERLRRVGRLWISRAKEFEIWDRRRFEEYERSHGDALASDFTWLSQVGVK